MITLTKVSVRYKGREDGPPAIRNVSLHIEKGTCVVICGKSGCGKTTLTRLINGLIPHFYSADMEGNVAIQGRDTSSMSLAEISKTVGSVFQNPKSQFFNLNTTSELAFGCENRGWDFKKIYFEIEKSANDFHLQPLLDRDIFSLSGGEKQRIACGSVYAMEPSIFVLDEPSSNMDMYSIGALKKILKILRENGATILISEHRLHYLVEIADRYVYLENGEVKGDFTLDELLEIKADKRYKMGLRMLDLKELEPYKCPLRQDGESIAMSMGKFSFSRGKRTILKLQSVPFYKNSVVAIVGENGVGKSTLVSCLMGFLKYKGDVLINGRPERRKRLVNDAFLVMQDVNRQLFANTVLQEVRVGAKRHDPDYARKLLETFGLAELSDRHPASLSGGQKQRLAVASAVYSGKKFLFFDEPTSGLDKHSLVSFQRMIMELKKSSACIFIITHDPELLFPCSDYILRLNRDLSYEYGKADETGCKKTISYFQKLYQEGENNC